MSRIGKLFVIFLLIIFVSFIPTVGYFVERGILMDKQHLNQYTNGCHQKMIKIRQIFMQLGKDLASCCVRDMYCWQADAQHVSK